MRILYLVADRYEYLQDSLYCGLVSVLGKSNVLDFPRSKTYHEPGTSYPHSIGYHSESEASERRSIFVRRTLKKLQPDVVIVASCKQQPFGNYLRIRNVWKGPIIFIDGGDSSAIGGDLLKSKTYRSAINRELPRFTLIFKRELTADAPIDQRIFPLTFSINVDHFAGINTAVKQFDIAYFATANGPQRRAAYDILAGKFTEGIFLRDNTTLHSPFNGAAYLQRLAASRIGVSIRGSGFDTLRYWEIPLCKTMLLSEMPTIRIPDNFQNERHAVFCKNDLSDLIDKTLYFSQHPQESAQIAQAGFEHSLRFHQPRNRAEYVLNIIQMRLCR
jgi:hypothetical protein